LSAEDAQAGRRMKCPTCGASVVVPAPPPLRGPTIRIEKSELEPVAPAAKAAPGAPSAKPAFELAPLDAAAPDAASLPQAMKANRRYEGKVCPVCQAQIKLGEDLCICRHCKLPFHKSCWEENGGCATYGCEGAKGARPKQSFADFAVSVEGGATAATPRGEPAPYQPPGYPPTYPAPTYQPARTSGMAVASLVLGLLWVCGLGSLLAVVFGHFALSEIAKSQGQMTGRGMAIAGLILGYLGLAGSVLPLLMTATGSMV